VKDLSGVNIFVWIEILKYY